MTPEAQLARYFARYEPAMARFGKALRAKMRARLPGLFEIVYVYENQSALVIAYSPTANGYEGVCSIGLYPDEAKLFLTHGAALSKSDPNRLLQGHGKTVRHVVLKSAADLDRADIEALLAAALKLAKVAPKPGASGEVVIRAEAQKERAVRAKKVAGSRSPQRKERSNTMAKMKSYPSFDAYLKDQPRANQTVIRALRKLVKRAAPSLEEAVKYGNGCWVQGKHPIAYVYAAADHTQFGFIAGAKLADPKGLLEGSGAYVRHTKLRSTRDIAERDLVALLAQAVERGHPAAKKAAKAPKAKTKAKAKR